MFFALLYPYRSLDKGRSIIISDRIIDEYAEGNEICCTRRTYSPLVKILMTIILKFKAKFISDTVAHRPPRRAVVHGSRIFGDFRSRISKRSDGGPIL